MNISAQYCISGLVMVQSRQAYAFRYVAEEVAMSPRIFAEERKPLRVPAMQSFAVAAHFTTESRTEPLGIGCLGEHFRQHLGKLHESPSVQENLFWNRLIVEAYDEDRVLRRGRVPGIVPTLGGTELAVVTLGQFWFGLVKADRTLSYAAYVRDVQGETVGVMARWMRVGLYIESGPYDRPYSWGAGTMFLSR